MTMLPPVSFPNRTHRSVKHPSRPCVLARNIYLCCAVRQNFVAFQRCCDCWRFLAALRLCVRTAFLRVFVSLCDISRYVFVPLCEIIHVIPYHHRAKSRASDVIPVLRSLLLICALLFAAALAAGQAARSPAPIEVRLPRGTMSLHIAGEPGRYTGFDLQLDERRLFPVRFGSAGAITCERAVFTPTKTGGSLLFDNLTAGEETGLILERSTLRVSLSDGHFPVVTIDLHVKSFDPNRWRRRFGNNPFHFLTLGFPEAAILHQHGWLIPTPTTDPFPMLDDVPVGSVRRSAYPYNRQWTLRTALDQQAMPVIGLWSPRARLYAGWDFLRPEALATSGICSACCNRLLLPAGRGTGLDDAPASADRQADIRGVSRFVALVYPRGEHDDRQFDYPRGGEELAVTARLIAYSDLDDTDDPNRRIWESWWTDPETAALLPYVPGAMHFGAPRDDEASQPGPLLDVAGGWNVSEPGWIEQNPVDLAYAQRDTDQIRLREREAALLLRTLRRFHVDGDACVYWTTPWRGPDENPKSQDTEEAVRLHHAGGWAAGRLLLSVYRHKTKLAVLPAIDGVLSWAKHVVWQRWNGAPAKVTLTDEALRISFLLDYYATFIHDFDRRELALKALELAHSGAYRALIMRPTQSVLPAFTWETTNASSSSDPEQGEHTSRTALSGLSTPSASSSGNTEQGEHLGAALIAIGRVAVATGDPILLWALRGTLAGTRLPAKESVEIARKLLSSPGDLHVFAGEKAAFSLTREGISGTVIGGRRAESGDLALTLRCSHSPFSVTLTVPGADLSGRAVTIVRDRIVRIPARSGENLVRGAAGLETITVTGLRDGDTLQIGDPALARTESLIVRPPRPAERPPGQPK
jgi:hypothetical protein